MASVCTEPFFSIHSAVVVVVVASGVYCGLLPNSPDGSRSSPQFIHQLSRQPALSTLHAVPRHPKGPQEDLDKVKVNFFALFFQLHGFFFVL